jgi:hypothetical protein
MRLKMPQMVREEGAYCYDTYDYNETYHKFYIAPIAGHKQYGLFKHEP